MYLNSTLNSTLLLVDYQHQYVCSYLMCRVPLPPPLPPPPPPPPPPPGHAPRRAATSCRPSVAVLLCSCWSGEFVRVSAGAPTCITCSCPWLHCYSVHVYICSGTSFFLGTFRDKVNFPVQNGPLWKLSHAILVMSFEGQQQCR